ncbi:MAG TPA: hypothetical protein VK689_20250 [Armatimonadota bacterium]|nr:hypothetical protein [Armatimonadota bacterium]
MNPADEPQRQPADEDETALSVQEKELLSLLAGRLARADRPGLNVSLETVRALERACPPVELGRGMRARLAAIAGAAAADLEFETALSARKQHLSLGAYLVFLRARAGLTVREAAEKYRFDFQLLTELERDSLPPQRIPGRRLAHLLRRLRGSLELTERLIFATVRAPRYITVDPRGSLYRGRPGARRAASRAASLAARGEVGEQRENPDYEEEVLAARRLVEEARVAWRKR